MLFFQITVECIRVILVFECSYDPSAPYKYISDAIVMISFLIAMWALLVNYRAGYEELAPFYYGYKFLYFKLMIFVSKFLYTILVWIAQSGKIPDFKRGDGVVVLKGKQRVESRCY